MTAPVTAPPVVEPGMADPRALIRGAMEHTLSRRFPDGSLLEFEQAPRGWTTKDGKIRQEDWRAYWYTPPGATRRRRFPSVTTVLDPICAKGGLPMWAEARGIEGLLEALRTEQIDLDLHPDDVVREVRRLKLGAEAARKNAARRGLNVHALLEAYMRTGAPPTLAGHPVEHHGYIRALTRWLLAVDPEPEEVEQLVMSPRDGYAGRLDLKALVGGVRRLYDAKTQERAAIYDSAHLQVRLYDRADRASGGNPADELWVVVFAADGEYDEMPCVARPETVASALRYWRLTKPIRSACQQRNTAQRKQRTEAAAEAEREAA